MAKYLTNGDKVLQAVLSDQKLCEFADYNVADFETISEALDSDNPIVCAIAKIIDGNERSLTEREIYNEISNYLKQTI
ncbi:MAG: hypothetical protein EOM44_05640 [Bacteroidia bacterium]|nr:hypothetical protein [Bacteroidia bacterium]